MSPANEHNRAQPETRKRERVRTIYVSVGAVTWCRVLHRAAQDKGPAGAERQEVATSCNSLRFGAQTSKGIRNPMLYPLELRAHRTCI